MGHKVDFIIPNRVLVIYMYDALALNDFQKIAEATFAALDTAEGSPIHNITYIEPNTDYPKTPETISSIVKSVGGGKSHPKTGWVITVSSSPIVRFVATVSAQMFMTGTMRYAATQSLEEALTYLKARDAGLSEMDVQATASAFESWRAAARASASKG